MLITASQDWIVVGVFALLLLIITDKNVASSKMAQTSFVQQYDLPVVDFLHFKTMTDCWLSSLVLLGNKISLLCLE